jgi:hypothetical protein
MPVIANFLPLRRSLFLLIFLIPAIPKTRPEMLGIIGIRNPTIPKIKLAIAQREVFFGYRGEAV